MAIMDKATSDKDTLHRLRETISNSYRYFQDNYKRYRQFRRYAFKSTISFQQRTILTQQQKPVIEFNIVSAYISRLLGEFAGHEPSIDVTPQEGNPVQPQVIALVEGNLRYAIDEANKNNFAYEIYKDILSGGFSVGKVYTDYESPMSFKQKIFWNKTFDCCLCGFDPLARASHKGDGRFCFELYPMRLEDFEKEYPKASIKDLDFARNEDEFNWSYKDGQNTKVVLVVDYYEKKKRRKRIFNLANGQTITESNYKKMVKYWEDQGIVPQMPVIVGKPRWTELETICRYKMIKSEILEYEETDYAFLPLVFFDGDSAILTQSETNNDTYQMTRPTIYNALGIQELQNLAGISLANHFDSLMQSKFILKKEAIPQEEDYLDALTNIQQPGTIVVNAFNENNPEQAIPEPIREVINAPAPPEIMQTFTGASQMAQTIMGGFASNLNKNDTDLSGNAVIQLLSAGNSTAMPEIVGYMQGLTQMARIHVDLMPKYLVGKRTIPVTGRDGSTEYSKINQDGAPYLDYEEHAIKVHIEAGLNFRLEKDQALKTIIALMQASEEFASFMNSPDGLKILLQNINIVGADALREAAEHWEQQKQQMQQQQQQQAMQMAQLDPRMIKAKADAQKVQIEGQGMQLKAQQAQFDNQIQIAKIAIEKELADAKIIESEAKVSQAQIDSAVRLEEAQTSLEVHALESASKLAEIKSREHDDSIKAHEATLKAHDSHRENVRLAHEIEQANKPQESKSNAKT